MNINYILATYLLAFSAFVNAEDQIPPPVKTTAPISDDAAQPSLEPADIEPITPFKMRGSADFGLLHHKLSQNQPSWNSQFFRGVLHTTPNQVWQMELLKATEFGDKGTLLVLGNTYDINENWYTSNSIAVGRDALFLSRRRIDSAISRKWLDKKNLITTVALNAIQAMDEHREVSMLLAASYYFTQPWIIQGGIHLNRSNPGRVYSNSKYTAVTYGHNQQHLVSLLFSAGTEAYQVIGNNAQISDFKSKSLTLTWRQWIRPHQGFQLRLEGYKNPSYERYGTEISVFHAF